MNAAAAAAHRIDDGVFYAMQQGTHRPDVSELNLSTAAPPLLPALPRLLLKTMILIKCVCRNLEVEKHGALGGFLTSRSLKPMMG